MIQQNNIKITIINYGKMINEIGGVNRVITELSNALSNRNYQVSVISMDQNQGEPSFKLNENIKFLPIGQRKPIYLYPPIRDLICFSTNQNERHKHRGLFLMKWQSSLFTPVISKINDSDIIISSHAEITYILRKILKIEKPLITMFHSKPEYYINRPVWDILREGVDQSDALQVLMPSYIKIASQNTQCKHIIYIPNYVKQTISTAKLINKKIICVGRLSQEKYPELLIEAFSILTESFPDWIVEWYGPINNHSSYTNKIKKLISEKNLSNKFILKGASLDISKHLLEASIFAFPSKFEGFPLALTEAMSYGLPAVGLSGCSGVNELIQNNINGLLTSNNPIAFSEALSKLMDDQNYRIRLGIRAKLKMKNFAPEIVWNDWEELINKILSY